MKATCILQAFRLKRKACVSIRLLIMFNCTRNTRQLRVFIPMLMLQTRVSVSNWRAWGLVTFCMKRANGMLGLLIMVTLSFIKFSDNINGWSPWLTEEKDWRNWAFGVVGLNYLGWCGINVDLYHQASIYILDLYLLQAWVYGLCLFLVNSDHLAAYMSNHLSKSIK